MCQYDTKFDLKIKVTMTYISCCSGFALYLEEYLMYKHTFQLCQYDTEV